MSHNWFFCSTPLHIFTACALADQLFKNDDNRLLLIDQPNMNNHDYFDLLQKLPHSPFSDIHIFAGRITNSLKKWRSRQKVAQQLAALIEKNVPSRILTGNDRRVEFQWAMHLAQQRNPQCQGVYMDEGTFTYMGRQASNSLGDRYVDQWLKKWAYGAWWQNPPTIGGSDWIHQIYAAFPKEVVAILKTKDIRAILPEYFQAPTPSALSSALLARYQVSHDLLAGIQTLVTLPHESLAKPRTAVRQALNAAVTALSTRGPVAIKYHPRDTQDNWLGVAPNQATVLPKRINFESLLPQLPAQACIIGDLSSTLLTTRWMRQDLKVIALKLTDRSHPLHPILTQIGVELMDLKTLLKEPLSGQRLSKNNSAVN